MAKTLQTIALIVGMAAGVASSTFAVFKWMDKQQDADTSHSQQLSINHEQDSIWKAEMLADVRAMSLKADSAIIIGLQNNTAIASNREVLMKYIESDSSLTGADMVDILSPFFEELKKNSMWTLSDGR